MVTVTTASMIKSLNAVVERIPALRFLPVCCSIIFVRLVPALPAVKSSGLFCLERNPAIGADRPEMDVYDYPATPAQLSKKNYLI